jgi:hypothetical protein
MALSRAQNRWRPRPNAGPPPQNEWADGKANHPQPPEQVLAKIVEDDKTAHDGDAPLGTHKHMNVGDPLTGGQSRDHEWMGREAQHPLPPGELRAQIVEAYQAEHHGPDARPGIRHEKALGALASTRSLNRGCRRAAECP